jgi:hypothetical protein
VIVRSVYWSGLFTMYGKFIFERRMPRNKNLPPAHPCSCLFYDRTNVNVPLASLAPIAENKGTGHLEERPLSVFATNNPQDFVKQATTNPGKLRKKHIYIWASPDNTVAFLLSLPADRIGDGVPPFDQTRTSPTTALKRSKTLLTNCHQQSSLTTLPC